MKTVACRVFQVGMRGAAYCLPWREPLVLAGPGSLQKLPELVRFKGLRSVLVVTDKTITALGLTKPLLEGLGQKGIRCRVYDGTVPNPTIHNVEAALALYRQGGCEAIIAVGGGSAIDCAKVVGARVARPRKPVSRMKGLLRIWKPLPPLFAVPTTAGTGSEATLAAVIVDSDSNHKYPINDFSLFPQYAVLDPLLTLGLPQQLTYTTGMDALTHAVEAYIGRSNTKGTLAHARRAVEEIFHCLPVASREGGNLEARERMQTASYDAGVAFTRAYVGNVHAIAHALGGMYGIPHGLANTIILPIVLEYYGPAAHKPLAELARLVGIARPGEGNRPAAERFIHTIRRMNAEMGIPACIPEICPQDIPLMVRRADSEANPLYPVPRVLTRKELTALFHIIRG